MRSRITNLLVSAAAAASLMAPAWGFQAPAAAAAKPRPGGRGPRGAAPDDNVGFKAIFDGRTLAGWEGEAGFWRAEDGVLIGETTEEKKLKQNTFILWRGGTVADFEFKAEFRLTEGANSGVQYRSTNLKEVGPFVLKGYQADMDGKSNFTGMLYEERGRGFVAPRGQAVRMEDGGVAKLMGSPGDNESLKALIKPGEWNQIHIIGRGNVLAHLINGRVFALCVDDDSKGRAMEGMLGLQLHVGPPMKVEFRNILLKQ
jgi:hypothetical protein